MQVVDARGKPCPQPVVLTRQAMKQGLPFTTIVDNEVSMANVSRMARSAGWHVETDKKEDGFHLVITPGGLDATLMQAAQTRTQSEATATAKEPLVLFLASDVIGQGDDTLGQVLMRALISTLQEVEPRPDVVVFMNNGVRLATEGSPVADDLRLLEEAGIELLVCGTCLDFFGLTDKLVVGTISNMYTIAETLLNASNVVRL